MGRRRLELGYARKPVKVPWPPPPPLILIELLGEPLSPTTVQLSFVNDPAATSYQYRINGGPPIALPTSRVIGSLAPNTTYWFQVRGVNSTAPGPWSYAAVVATPVVPSPPPPEVAPLRLAHATYSVIGATSSAGIITVNSNSLSIVPTGGVPPYSFGYAKTFHLASEIADPTSTEELGMQANPSASTGTARFSAPVESGWMVNETWTLTVNDSEDREATATIAVQLSNYAPITGGGGGGGVGSDNPYPEDPNPGRHFETPIE